MPVYRIFWGADVVLIRTPLGDLELPSDEAVELGRELADRRLTSCGKPKITRRQFTSTETAEIIRLYRDDGLGVTELGSRFRRTPGSVSQLLQRHGIRRHRQHRPRVGVAAVG